MRSLFLAILTILLFSNSSMFATISSLQRCCLCKKSDGKELLRDDFSEWSKPPPLEEISIELSEIMHSSIILQFCYFLHLVTVIIAAMLLLLNAYLILLPCSSSGVGQEAHSLLDNLRHVLPMTVARAFNIGFCIVIIMQEQQISFLLKYTVSSSLRVSPVCPG
jgi:hypothetical protein